MRRFLIGLALALIVLPAWAQTRDENVARCNAKDSNLIISGCTALIQSGHETGEVLATAYYRRGSVYINSRFYDQAIDDLTQAIALKPDYDTAYNNRAYTYHMKGEDAKGLADANRSIALAPTASHFNTRAEIYEKLGERNKAIADYRATLQLDPNQDRSTQGLKRLGVTP